MSKVEDMGHSFRKWKRLNLRAALPDRISPKMKKIRLSLLAVIPFLASCGEKESRVKIEETRGLTDRDREPKLFATSDERFRDVKPSPVQGDAPDSWLALPAAQFRELNYRFGESGLGEVYVSLSGGSVNDNVNRWIRQFGRDPLSQADLAALDKISIAETEGVWVEAAGNYAAGMGQEARPGYALAGVIAEVAGRILTVKMVGPEQEVKKEKGMLKGFAASLRMAE